MGLPLQFWSEGVFKIIGDDLGTFLDYEELFIETGKMAFTWIMVHLDTREGLVESLLLWWQGYSRMQKLTMRGFLFIAEVAM